MATRFDDLIDIDLLALFKTLADSKYADASDVPTKTSDLSNDSDYQTSTQATNIANTVMTNNAPGYQTASQVTAAINNAISGITGISFEIVQALPASGGAGVIYLLPNSGSAPNIYDEYVWVNNAWEKIGTTDVDLSGYVEDSDITLATNADVQALFA